MIRFGIERHVSRGQWENLPQRYKDYLTDLFRDVNEILNTKHKIIQIWFKAAIAYEANNSRRRDGTNK